MSPQQSATSCHCLKLLYPELDNETAEAPTVVMKSDLCYAVDTRYNTIISLTTVKPLIILVKDTLKEDKPPNKGQGESTLVHALYRKSPLKEDNLSTKDKMAGPESVLIITIL